MIINSYIFSSAPSYTARTTAFATATAITDTTILNALNTFDLGLISNGLDTKMKALYPFVGGTSTTHKYNFMDARDLDAAFRLTFNGGWVHSANGIQGNATNAYANTFYNPTTQSLVRENAGLSLYINQTSSTDAFDMAVVSGASYLGMAFYGADNYMLTYDDSNFNNTYTSKLGLWTATRTSTTSQFSYQNGVLKGSRTGFSSTAQINFNMYIGARNQDGSVNAFSNRRYGISMIHEGLDSTQASNLYTLVQAFQTSLSRQV